MMEQTGPAGSTEAPERMPAQARGPGSGTPDPVAQTEMGSGDIPAPIQYWEGMNNINGVMPPDPNGDVGPNHYVQMVNLSTAIYNKTGGLLFGPVNSNTFWAGFGGALRDDERRRSHCRL